MSTNTPSAGTQLSIGVATSTVIALDANDPFRVCLIQQAKKHRQRKTLVGGKRTGSDSHEDTAIGEFSQEAGGKGATLLDVKLWAIKTDRLADVRTVTLGRATDDLCPSELASLEVIAHYGYPDYLYIAAVEGTPAPKDGEAKNVVWMDVRDIVITECEEDSTFGAQHDLILALYRYALEGDARVGDLAIHLSDMNALRTLLLSMQG